MENKLFDIDPIEKPINSNKCGYCKHIQKWEFNAKYFFYCAITKSNRTQNKLLKVKCKTIACSRFEKDNFLNQ